MNIWVVVNVNHAGNFHTKGEAAFVAPTPEECELFIQLVKENHMGYQNKVYDDLSMHGPFWIEEPVDDDIEIPAKH